MRNANGLKSGFGCALTRERKEFLFFLFEYTKHSKILDYLAKCTSLDWFHAFIIVTKPGERCTTHTFDRLSFFAVVAVAVAASISFICICLSLSLPQLWPLSIRHFCVLLIFVDKLARMQNGVKINTDDRFMLISQLFDYLDKVLVSRPIGVSFPRWLCNALRRCTYIHNRKINRFLWKYSQCESYPFCNMTAVEFFVSRNACNCLIVYWLSVAEKQLEQCSQCVALQI